MNGSLIVMSGLAAALVLGGGHTLAQSPSAGGPSAPTLVPLDSEASMGGVQIACTGVGQSKDEPKWKAYPVRIEFSNPSGAFLANGAVTISSAAGAPLASVSCEGPWILVRPAAGRGGYRVTGWLPGQGYKPVSQSFTVPSGGQRVIDLRFAAP